MILKIKMMMLKQHLRLKKRLRPTTTMTTSEP